MGYLICEECNIYYEAENESEAEDFLCECGNNVIYFEYLEDYYETDPDEDYVRERMSDGLTHTEYHAFKHLAEKKQASKLFFTGLFISSASLILTISLNSLFLILLPLGVVSVLYGGHKKQVKDVEGYSWIRGLKGENTVFKYLETLPKDYFIFNDVKLYEKRGNIDHIVVGPTGIFVIETKNYSGRYRIKGNQWFYYKDGGYKKLYRTPASQIINNAVDLKKFLKSKGIPVNGLWIGAIVAFINHDFRVLEKPKPYKVLVPKTVPKFILNSKRKVDRKLINRIVLLLEPYSTDISVSHKIDKKSEGNTLFKRLNLGILHRNHKY
ncbi:Nuclease-related domain protein [anaerobic digester metagenome]